MIAPAQSISLPQFPDAGALTHSSEATFKACPRKYFLRYVQGIRPKYTADPLRFGSVFHAGLEAIKQGGDEMTAADVVRTAHAEHECPPYIDADEWATERETITALVRGWYRRWHSDLILDYEAVELEFDLPIVNPATGRSAVNVRSRGKIDGIARLPDGRLALIEYKTCGEKLEPDSDYWKRLLIDGQISRYVLAARALGYPVETTIFDVTRKPAISPKNVTKVDRQSAAFAHRYFGLPLEGMCPERETPEMFGARLLHDTLTRPEFYFARMEIPRLESDLTEYQAEQWIHRQHIRQCERGYEESGIAAWPRNTGSCVGFGRCVYLDCCRGLRGDPTEGVPEGFVRAERLHPELSTPAVAPEGTRQ